MDLIITWVISRVALQTGRMHTLYGVIPRYSKWKRFPESFFYELQILDVVPERKTDGPENVARDREGWEGISLKRSKIAKDVVQLMKL